MHLQLPKMNVFSTSTTGQTTLLCILALNYIKNIVFHKSIPHIKSLKAQNHSFPYTRSSPHHSQHRLSYHTVQLTYLPFYLFERPVFFWGWHMHISVMPPQTTHSVMLLSCYSWGTAFFAKHASFAITCRFLSKLYMFKRFRPHLECVLD